MILPTDPIEWFRYPFVAAHDLAKEWLTTESLLGLAPNTLDTYARGLNDFLQFCQKADISPAIATRADLARYVGDLRGRPQSAPHQGPSPLTLSIGLSNTTLQQQLTAALTYDAGLRREEHCSLLGSDLDPAHQLIRVRAEIAKGSREGVVPYSETSGELLRTFLEHRRTLAKSRDPLFLSESPRNFAQPISL
jgi:site-specific recombinase XerD